MAAVREQQIASALNSAINCNLFGGADDDRLRQLINDYFCDDNGDESDTEFDSEDGESEDEHENITQDLLPSSDNEASDHEDTPLVTAAEVTTVLGAAGENVPSAFCVADNNESQRVENFSCSCKHHNGGPCSVQFTKDFITRRRLEMKELSEGEKDLLILGMICTQMNLSDSTVCSKRREQKDRMHQRTTYMIESFVVCRDTFKFLLCISQNKLTALIKHFKENGLTVRRKKSGGRKSNTRSFSYDDIKAIVTFITNFAEENALLLPGRVPGFKRSDIRLLPSSETKASVWRKYVTAMAASGRRAAKLSSFRQFWRQLVPYIVRTKPMSDLCWECQRNNLAVYKSANLPEELKSEQVKKQQQHLLEVQLERSLYKSMIDDAKQVVISKNITSLGPNTSASHDFTMHYSFDYAQQVHYPSDPLQPGPMYFLVPRKCGIFGICCEALPQQINYLIDEGMCISKGSNAVISYLHHFFSHWGLGETDLHLHCDNCSGQDKNKYVLWYLAWRAIHKKHLSVTVNFMVSGHTKFGPDWCFGLLKQNYRRTPVSDLKDIANVVSSSTLKGSNIPQLVGSEDGKVFIPTSDWQSFLEPYFKPLPGIKRLHHFRFSANNPGLLYYKVRPDDKEESMQLLLNKTRLPSPSGPNELRPPGLPLQRQWYLYRKIREFVHPDSQDTTCPQPSGNELDEDIDDVVGVPTTQADLSTPAAAHHTKHSKSATKQAKGVKVANTAALVQPSKTKSARKTIQNNASDAVGKSSTKRKSAEETQPPAQTATAERSTRIRHKRSFFIDEF